MDEILDSEYPIKKKVKWTEFVPVILVTLLFIWKIYNVLAHNYVFEFESAIAYLIVAIVTGLYFVNRGIYVYSLLFVFIIGALGFFNFTPAKIIISIGIISINPTSLLLVFVHLITFYKTLEINNKESEKIENRNLIDSFKTKYVNKSASELTEIINSKGFRDEAKQAAAEILSNKKENA